MKLFTAAALVLLSANVHQAFASNNTNIRETVLEQGGKHRFLKWEDLPPGLQDNPGHAINVLFKEGRKPAAQMVDADQFIFDLDGEVIDLNTLTPQNIFSADHYELSEDGTYVTDIETGEPVQIEVFGSGFNHAKVIIATKDEDGLFNDIRIHKEGRPGQSFKKTGEIYLGYSDDDVDTDKLNEIFEMKDLIVPDDPNGGRNGKGNDNGNRKPFQERKRGLVWQNYFQSNSYCASGHDVVFVAITLDKAFYDALGTGAAQSIFYEAQYRYWLSGCAYIYVSHWEVEWWANNYGNLSGCNGYGSLQRFQVAKQSSTVFRDAWHLFSGVDFADGSVIGCAYTGGACRGNGYGSNHMTFTNDLNMQGTLFAHELGHNLGAPHSANGGGIMGGRINGGDVMFDSASMNAMQSHISNNC